MPHSVAAPSARSGLFHARGLRWMGFYLALLLAWGGVFFMDPAASPPAGVGAPGLEYWRALCGIGAPDASLARLWAMWALMSAAMMTPTAIPAFRTYDDLIRAGAGSGPGFAALIGGYVAVWLGFAALGGGAQAALAGAGLVDQAGRSLTLGLNAGLLGGAGLYQFSRLKESCLSQCRSPMSFFMAHWRGGARGGLAMGARLGAVCVGCCWALMLLAFVGGTMSLAWMALAALMMTFEKLPQLGRWLTRPLGFALLGGALAMGAAALGQI